MPRAYVSRGCEKRMQEKRAPLESSKTVENAKSACKKKRRARKSYGYTEIFKNVVNVRKNTPVWACRNAVQKKRTLAAAGEPVGTVGNP